MRCSFTNLRSFHVGWLWNWFLWQLQSTTIKTLIHPGIYKSEFYDLPQHGKIMAEYIWIGGSGNDIRSKSRTLNAKPTSPSELPLWNYDGSSTGQAPGHDSECVVKPQAIFPDPFRGGDNILVMCDTYEPLKPGQTEMTPLPSNGRCKAAKLMSDPRVLAEDPWFGIEQEYTLLDADTKWPLGWPAGGYPGPQGPYYCGNGAGRALARDVCDAHYKACLYAGVKISGTNAEVMPSQWEYQVGPCQGIESGDHMWMSRFLLERVAERFNVLVSFDPKPIPGEWNGAGCHTNYSTKATRTAPGGYDAIVAQIKKLEARHVEHIKAYGEGNERRLTGRCETASIHKFSYGVADRGSSIRIPRSVPVEDCGYYEDRRPASNMDPYVVTGKIVETTLLM